MSLDSAQPDPSGGTTTALQEAQRTIAAEPPAPKPPPPVTTSRLLKALFLIALIALLKVAQPLLVPVVVAVILTFVLTPSVRWLHRRGIDESIGAALLVVALLGATTAIGAMLYEPATRVIERAPNTVALLMARLDRLRASVPLIAPPPPPPQPAPKVASRSAPLAQQQQQPAPPEPPPKPDPIKEKITATTVEMTGELLGGALTFAIAALATLILLYFLLASEYWMLSRTVEAIRRRRTRALVLSGVRAAQTEISQFLGALALINVGVGTLTGLALWAIGLPNPLLWGAVAAALNFIPYIGPLIMSVLLVLAGLVAFDDASALVLAPTAVFLLVHFIEANFVTPTFIGKRLTLSPISVFLSVMFWAWLWGIVGAVIAVPLLVGLRAVCKRNRQWKLLCVYLEGAHREAPSLRSLVRLRSRRRAPAVLPPRG